MLITASCGKLQYSGRIDDKNPDMQTLVFPCSSITIRFRGSEIYAILENRNVYWDNYIGVILDGKQTKIRLENGIKQTVCLGKNLKEEEHILMLFKRQDSCHELIFYGFEIPDSGEVMEPLPRPSRKLEIFGDSVSAGEVSEAVEYAGKPDPEHNGQYSNSWYSYGWITARKLNAQLHDIAQGGAALMDGTGWFCAPNYIGMESIWDKVHYNPMLGMVTEWDFSRYIPHVVIVAIGQNDNNPEDYMKKDPEGEKAASWKQHYKSWIAQIREKYPNALIILTTTVLEHCSKWDDAIEEVCKQMKDSKIVHFLYHQNGCQTPGHIRIPEAEAMAEELTEFITSFGEEIWDA